TGSGPGTASGTPPMSGAAAPAVHTPAAGDPPAVAGASPIVPGTQLGPPVISGAAAASALNAIAAPHNAALATTPMLNRPKIVIDVYSLIRAQTFPQSTGAAEPHSRNEVVCLEDRLDW